MGKFVQFFQEVIDGGDKLLREEVGKNCCEDRSIDICCIVRAEHDIDEGDEDGDRIVCDCDPAVAKNGAEFERS